MRKLAFYIFCGILLTNCGAPSPKQVHESKARVLAVSWFYPNSDYQRWVHDYDSTWTFVELYSLEYDQLDSALNAASGLILTGGSDIAPSRYGTVDSLSACGKIDSKRDSFELYAFKFALRSQLPTLGVCRGMQVMNVAQGGSLHLDIPSELGSFIHQLPDTDAVHMVYVEHSRFKTMTGVDSGSTNSNHHQGIKKLGNGFIPLAKTNDNLIEAISYQDTTRFPFVVGVQWHPERMERTSPLAEPVLTDFLENVTDFYHEMD